MRIPGEANARRKIVARIREGLEFIAEARVEGEIRPHAPIVLRERAEQNIVDRVAGVTVALGVGSDVVDVAEIARLSQTLSGSVQVL